MITIDNTMEEYMKTAKSTVCGNELIIPIMLITELKKLNDNLDWLTFKIKRDESWE